MLILELILAKIESVNINKQCVRIRKNVINKIKQKEIFIKMLIKDTEKYDKRTPSNSTKFKTFHKVN